MKTTRRQPATVNAGSMADIAFLLLLFFLVTTTMDADTGLRKKLSPKPEKPFKNLIYKERNVFEVLVNANNDLLVEGEPMQLSELREEAKKFIIGDPNFQNEAMPEGKPTQIPLLGKKMVSKQIISLQNDRATTYEMYIKVQNELIAAYNEIRNEYALKTFGRSLEDLKKASKSSKKAKLQLSAIKKIYPQRISEAEPKNIGG